MLITQLVHRITEYRLKSQVTFSDHLGHNIPMQGPARFLHDFSHAYVYYVSSFPALNSLEKQNKLKSANLKVAHCTKAFYFLRHNVTR